MTQPPPRPVRRPDPRRVGPAALTVGLLLLSATMWVSADLLHAGPGAQHWWVAGLLLVTFVVVEATHLHVEFRRQTDLISLSEIPLVIGLFTVHPGTLLAVRVLAALVVALALRRSPLKTAFNAALFAAEVSTAAAIVAWVGVYDPADYRSWLAVLAAIAALTTVSTVCLQSVFWLTQ